MRWTERNCISPFCCCCRCKTKLFFGKPKKLYFLFIVTKKLRHISVQVRVIGYTTTVHERLVVDQMTIGLVLLLGFLFDPLKVIKLILHTQVSITRGKDKRHITVRSPGQT